MQPPRQANPEDITAPQGGQEVTVPKVVKVPEVLPKRESPTITTSQTSTQFSFPNVSRVEVTSPTALSWLLEYVSPTTVFMAVLVTGMVVLCVVRHLCNNLKKKRYGELEAAASVPQPTILPSYQPGLSSSGTVTSVTTSKGRGKYGKLDAKKTAAESWGSDDDDEFGAFTTGGAGSSTNVSTATSTAKSDETNTLISF